MTYEEAKNVIGQCVGCKYLFDGECISENKCFDAKVKAIEALEKQIQKKPYLWNNEKHICPNCHRTEYIKNEPLNTYCGFCGQALDWSIE